MKLGDSELKDLRWERVELTEKKKDLELQLSRFDRILSTEQAKIRGMGLPRQESLNLWFKRKAEILAERDGIMDEKAKVEHRLSRVRLHLQELSDADEEYVVVCPRCLKTGNRILLHQDGYTLTCPKGHTFTLVEDI